MFKDLVLSQQGCGTLRKYSLNGGSVSLREDLELSQVCSTPLLSLLLIPTRHGVKNPSFHTPGTMKQSDTLVDCMPSNCKPT